MDHPLVTDGLRGETCNGIALTFRCTARGYITPLVYTCATRQDTPSRFPWSFSFNCGLDNEIRQSYHRSSIRGTKVAGRLSPFSSRRPLEGGTDQRTCQEPWSAPERGSRRRVSRLGGERSVALPDPGANP